MSEPDRAHRTALRGDCERCVGLCCVGPAFAASADFAITKPAATACPNLAEDSRCTIHSSLRAEGFPGCIAYDCFGAGQQVTQVTFAGHDWRQDPDLAGQMFAAFGVMGDLHELLWYLHEARLMPPATPLHPEIDATLEAVQALTWHAAQDLIQLDPLPHRARVNDLLLRVSELVRATADHDGDPVDLTRADLIGADLQGHDLRGALLFSARCIGADLTRADLSGADLRGTDLRGADLSGADLTDSIFLIQAQVSAAHGDPNTLLPASVTRPDHWGGPAPS